MDKNCLTCIYSSIRFDKSCCNKGKWMKIKYDVKHNDMPDVTKHVCELWQGYQGRLGCSPILPR